MVMRAIICLFALLWFSKSEGVFASLDEVAETKNSHIIPATLAAIYSGSETLHYAVSWSGGVKIGDIYLRINQHLLQEDAYAIVATVKSDGPLKLIYPVDDTFTCYVSGPMKLPYRYEVQQREGFGREITRLTLYDQANRVVRYRKNKDDEQRFDLTGTVYNEFASFLITRALVLREHEAIVVPTFADKKRHEVKVSLLRKEKRSNLFGETDTLVVQPQMAFKGLYEKSGDTTLWLTDDRCRVPVEIRSRIIIGSLVAELVEYANSACPELSLQVQRERGH